MSKIAIEEWVAIGLMCVAFGGVVTVVLKSFNKDNGIDRAMPTVSVVVRDPIDHTMILVKATPNWEFVHCTPTNKNCGRFE